MSWQKLGRRSLAIYGPPGTGKTTRILELLMSEIEHGTPADRIALVTFSKGAQLEAAARAASRLDLAPDETPWIRTLHSTAYQILGLSRSQVYSPQHHREFCSQHAYRITVTNRGQPADFTRAPRFTSDDALRAVCEWGLQRDVPLRQAWTEAPRLAHPVRWNVVERYARVFEAWKRDRNVFDFFDMLLHARTLPGPDVDVCFIDEAQDLTPLQLSLVYAWFSDCERVYVAGDDDQAIHGWNGADPSWLIGLRERCDHHEILSKSHRVPEQIRRVANRIIRQNTRRVRKQYVSAREGGKIRGRTIQQAISDVAEHSGSCLFLVRNRIHAESIVTQLIRQGVAFTSEIPPAGPLDYQGVFIAVDAAQRLFCGEAIPPEGLRALLDQWDLPGRLPPGTLERARRVVRRVSLAQLATDWGLGSAIDRLRAEGAAQSLVLQPTVVRSYLAAVLARHGRIPRPPPVTLTTIHAAKGREADLVVVLSDLTRATHAEWRADPEAENRVAYVACTRARRSLIVCDPPQVGRRRPQAVLSYPYAKHVDAVLRGKG